MKSLEQMIKECVKLSPQGDFHLEHLNDSSWGAGSCFNPKKPDEWYKGRTPKAAVSLFLKELNGQKR